MMPAATVNVLVERGVAFPVSEVVTDVVSDVGTIWHCLRTGRGTAHADGILAVEDGIIVVTVGAGGGIVHEIIVTTTGGVVMLVLLVVFVVVVVQDVPYQEASGPQGVVVCDVVVVVVEVQGAPG
jgi:hypothetical protein